MRGSALPGLPGPTPRAMARSPARVAPAGQLIPLGLHAPFRLASAGPPEPGPAMPTPLRCRLRRAAPVRTRAPRQPNWASPPCSTPGDRTSWFSCLRREYNSFCLVWLYVIEPGNFSARRSRKDVCSPAHQCIEQACHVGRTAFDNSAVRRIARNPSSQKLAGDRPLYSSSHLLTCDCFWGRVVHYLL